MGKNYELIYKARQLYDRERDQRWKVQREQEKLEKLEAETRKQLQKLCGPDERLIFDECSCVADGISRHVYKGPKTAIENIGKFVCIFCGCDDCCVD